MPLKLSALPYFPAAAQVVFTTVPSLPFPDPSATVDPDPSPNAYAATNPGTAAVYVAVYVAGEVGASMLCVAAPLSDQLGNA